MYIQRHLETQIYKYLNTKEIIAIVGVRQCGKTTLMKHLYNQLDNALFVDFEDREKLEIFEGDIETFIRLYVTKYDYLFLDEFQYVKEGGKNLKYIYDNYNTKIILSGSSSSELSIQCIQYLVGRIFIFQLNPLSFEEFLTYKDEQLLKEVYPNKTHSDPVTRRFNQYLNEFLKYGGFPRVVTSESDEEKQIVLKNIYDTYFLKEIKGIFNLTSDYMLSKLISALALQISGILNFNELCSTTGFRYPDLMRHLNVLNKTFITMESRPFYKNRRTELVKSPKIFFLDNGFRNTVVKNFQEIRDRSDAGSLRENFVASEMNKKSIKLNYWRTKAKAEVDFIVQKEGITIPIEVKSRLTEPKVTKSLRSFIDKYQPPRGFVVCEDLFAEKQIGKTSVQWVPVYHLSTHL